MSFTFLIYVFLVIVRPQEYVGSLQSLDLLRYTLLVGFVLWMFRSPKILSAPQQWLVPAFCVFAVLSRAALGWFGGVMQTLQDMVPMTMMFFVCASVAEDPMSSSCLSPSSDVSANFKVKEARRDELLSE